MAEGEIKNILIGIAIFVVLIAGSVDLMSRFNAENPEFLDQDKFGKFNYTFNKITESNANVENIKSRISNEQSDPGAFGVLNALIMTAWVSLRNIFESLSFLSAMFGGLYSVFGLPDYAGNMIVTILTIIIGYSIYALFFQRQP